MEKGSYGYIKAKRKKMYFWLAVDILFAVSLFVVGLFLNKFSKANIFTIFAMLFTIPGAKILVSLIVVHPFKGLSNKTYEEINNKVNDKKALLYDLVLTSPERVMYAKTIAITKESYVVLIDHKMINAKDKEKYTEHMINYLGKHMSNYGFEKTLDVVEDETVYISKIVDEELETENIDEIRKTLLILQV